MSIRMLAGVLIVVGIWLLCRLVRPGRCLYQVVWMGFGMVLTWAVLACFLGIWHF